MYFGYDLCLSIKLYHSYNNLSCYKCFYKIVTFIFVFPFNEQVKKPAFQRAFFVTEILNETFVFRTLNRFEYKQLVTFIDINALQREETICQTAVLWPIDYDYIKMSTEKAGIPSTLSEIIMEKSGFTKDFAIQEI